MEMPWKQLWQQGWAKQEKPGLGLVQQVSVSSGELNWELPCASSEEDLARAEGSHHSAATGLVRKITPENRS